MPKRPPWNFKMTKQQLEEREQKYFDKWLQDIYDNYPRQRLNYFEHNLEVWRQLWRVIERSDVLVVVTDARHPLFHFPPSLYTHVVHDHKKPIMLVLNKIDLVPEDVLSQWTEYFEKRYPLLKVVCFSSYPNEETVTLGKDAEVNTEAKRKRRKRRKYTAVGCKDFIILCAQFAQEKGRQIDLPEYVPSKEEEIDRTESETQGSDEEDEEAAVEEIDQVQTLEEDLDYADPETLKAHALKTNYVTIGKEVCVCVCV